MDALCRLSIGMLSLAPAGRRARGERLVSLASAGLKARGPGSETNERPSRSSVRFRLKAPMKPRRLWASAVYLYNLLIVIEIQFCPIFIRFSPENVGF